jgi:dTDP-4-amino-4,6-dideoxygalactose transaminase
MQIPIYKPELPPYSEVEPEIRAMYESGMLYPGPYTDRLVAEVEEFCDVNFCLPVSSCSVGLMLMLARIPQGSQVIMPAFTFNATLQALEWNGLVPLVVDVDDNGQLDPVRVCEALIDHPFDVKAILGVHMWGNLLDTYEFGRIAGGGMDGQVRPMFYDGAHALGSFDDEAIAPGTATCFSIAATKPVSAGEGGLIVTNDEDVFNELQDASSHGLHGSLDTRIKGINGKIQEFNSILAYHALKAFDKTRMRRTKIMEFYRDSFDDLPLRVWETREGVHTSSYKDCVVFADDRDALDAHVQAAGIGTKRYFEPAIPDMGSFKGIEHSAGNARRLAATCLTLPLYPALTDVEVEYIVRTVREFYE